MARRSDDEFLAAGFRPPRTGRLLVCGLRGRILAPMLLAGLLGACTGGRPTPDVAPATAPATASPATAPRGPVVFQPGIWIDWQRPEVQVQGHVVLREGPLEFLACLAGKEHESIVRMEATAAHIYLALGLIGLMPGRPPAWDPQSEQTRPPTGDLVDISVSWQQDEQARTADANQWLRETEYGRPPLPRPWVFAGSHRTAGGSLTADATGVGIAVVDFPDSLLCLSRAHTSRNSELWAEANTPDIPPLGTPVRLVLRPARRRTWQATLDLRGVLWVDARYCSPADLADLIALSRQLDPAYVQIVQVAGALHSDVARVRRALVAAGVPANALQLVSEAPVTTRSAPIAGGAPGAAPPP